MSRRRRRGLLRAIYIACTVSQRDRHLEIVVGIMCSQVTSGSKEKRREETPESSMLTV
jgi:hypothetical protein